MRKIVILVISIASMFALSISVFGANNLSNRLDISMFSEPISAHQLLTSKINYNPDKIEFTATPLVKPTVLNLNGSPFNWGLYKQ